MTERFVYGAGAGDRPVRSGRRSVRNFLLGFPEDVEDTILELHLKQYGEVGLWSRYISIFHHAKAKEPGAF